MEVADQEVNDMSEQPAEDLGTTVANAVFVVAIVAIIVVLISTIASLAASGRTEYCYIVERRDSGRVPTYELLSFRAWRQDRVQFSSGSIDNVIEVAKKIECPIAPEEKKQ